MEDAVLVGVDDDDAVVDDSAAFVGRTIVVVDVVLVWDDVDSSEDEVSLDVDNDFDVNAVVDET